MAKSPGTFKGFVSLSHVKSAKSHVAVLSEPVHNNADIHG